MEERRYNEMSYGSKFNDMCLSIAVVLLLGVAITTKWKEIIKYGSSGNIIKPSNGVYHRRLCQV
jgi:hypothetical protein